MQHGWLFTLGLSLLVVLGGILASRVEPEPSSAAADPCFRYGRFECCVRAEE